MVCVKLVFEVEILITIYFSQKVDKIWIIHGMKQWLANKTEFFVVKFKSRGPKPKSNRM